MEYFEAEHYSHYLQYNNFTKLLTQQREMIKYELVPYFTFKEAANFLKACKASAQLISSFMSEWKHLALILADHDESIASEL